eukprot:TRINITY_DN1450_c0_g1_i1.p1 TRINITY_DN1450_c0_g1~~TRINITY_DN1450_c0_g1_i1.p1  ORF type:complete len:120 (-),score=17.20 TRINITY_DN1450_c0_g1_i1:155-514(-)
MDLIQDRGVDERERAGDHQWDFIIEEFEQDSDHNLHHYMYHADNFITEIDPFHRGNNPHPQYVHSHSEFVHSHNQPFHHNIINTHSTGGAKRANRNSNANDKPNRTAQDRLHEHTGIHV